MSTNLAPIALFVYNRPEHTKQTIAALQKNILASASDLFIFCDGVKNLENQSAVDEVRNYLQNISGFKSVVLIKREKNLGLAESIITGVSEIVAKFGKVIVLEDDLVTAPHFLEFMNEALDLYENEETVISIHGYIYPVTQPLPPTFFLRGADCWGWATWKRGWELFERNGQKLLSELEKNNLTKIFDFDGTYHYTKMLQDQISGKNNSWAIRWYASAFLANKLTLYPGKSLVQNIGIDGSGTHCGTSSAFEIQINKAKVALTKIPAIENVLARQAVKNFFKPKKSFIQKIAHKIRKKIQKIRNKKNA